MRMVTLLRGSRDRRLHRRVSSRLFQVRKYLADAQTSVRSGLPLRSRPRAPRADRSPFMPISATPDGRPGLDVNASLASDRYSRDESVGLIVSRCLPAFHAACAAASRMPLPSLVHRTPYPLSRRGWRTARCSCARPSIDNIRVTNIRCLCNAAYRRAAGVLAHAMQRTGFFYTGADLVNTQRREPYDKHLYHARPTPPHYASRATSPRRTPTAR